jgi:hypothetical protein
VYHFNWYGFCKQYPPTTDEQLVEWSKKLRSSDVVLNLLNKGICCYCCLEDLCLLNATVTAKRISPLIPYRDTKTARVRVDQCQKWPENYVLLGDSMAYFTPVYGQVRSNCIIFLFF